MEHKDYSQMTLREFSDMLGSKEPAPGGGGASALCGCIGAALGNMVAHLTVGHKKYAMVEEEMEDIIRQEKILQTEFLGLIKKDAEMFLINATCFEGAWMEPYEDDQVKKDEVFTREDGTEEKATMLYSHTGSGAFYENEYLTGTSKAYRNGFQISFLLPREGVTVAEALDSLSGDDIYKLMTESNMAEVDLVIPEFGFDYNVPGCIDSLKDMGIRTVFDEDMADLSPMAVMNNGYNLYVDTVIHKTHIELDREGTKAAASTAIGIAKATGIMEDLPLREVRLDRPFIFVISDFQTMTPVFIGTVGSVA